MPAKISKTTRQKSKTAKKLSGEEQFLSLLQNQASKQKQEKNTKDGINIAKEIEKNLNSYLLAVKNSGCSKTTIRNYKSDIKQFLDFLGEKNLDGLGSKPKLLAFAKYQREKGLKDNSIKRKIISVGQFKNWLKKEGLLNSEIPLTPKQIETAPDKDLKALDFRKAIDFKNQATLNSYKPTDDAEDSTKLTQEEITKKRRRWFGAKQTIKKPHRRQNKLAIALNLIALLFFIAGLGYLAYQQFGQAVMSLAYPSIPTSPNRILSFQGRLTNTARTPIAAETDVSFALYDDVSAGNLLWSSNTCAITPDQDGIFNTNLGAGSGAGSDDHDCGGTIDDSVFTENSNVWLEVTVGTAPSTETLSPRQPIRTVAYAINSETVQGIRPSLIATHSTLLMLNDQGELVLGTDNPEVKTATGSSLMLEADSIMIQTQSGSDGDIVLSPDGIGNVGIGTNTPGYMLDVNGSANLSNANAYYINGTSVLSSTNLGLGIINSSLTSVGTLTTGTWNADVISEVYGGTNQSTYATGDLLYASGVDTLAKRTIGSAGQILTVSGGEPVWSDPSISADDLALSGIIAAISSNTINNEDYEQVWNWSLTSAGKSAFTFGENIASTATGNASILSASTLASSTAIPLYVKNLGNAASFRVDDESLDSTPFIIDESGQVGIGTDSPGAKLHIIGTADSEQLIIRANATQTSPLIVGQNSSGTELFRINSDGIHNFFAGYRSGANNTITGSGDQGLYNTAIGSNTLYTNTTGYQNSALGGASLYTNNAGYQNSAMGYASLYANTSGYQNSAMGYASLYANTTGFLNTASGFHAGRYLSGGAIANQTSNTSVYLGANTKALEAGVSNEIVLGYDTTGFGTNTAAYGNSSITEHIFQAGNVGIGTTDPATKLDLAGSFSSTTTAQRITNLSAASIDNIAQIGFALNRTTGGITEVAQIRGLITDIGDTSYKGALAFLTSTDNAAPTEKMRIAADGNVGIGVNNPSEKLVVDGTAVVEKIMDYTNNAYFLDPASSGTSLTTAGSVAIGSHTSGTARLAVIGGNVGIDTTDPESLLQVGDPHASQLIGSNTPTARLIGSDNSSTSETILRLARKGVTSGLYPAVVDFNVYSYSTSGSGPGTQLDIVLKSAGDWTETADVVVMTLRDDGVVEFPASGGSGGISVGGTNSIISNTSGDITIAAASDQVSLNAGSLINFAQTLGASGSLTAPTYSFSSDSNTGMYNPASDSLGFSVGGTSAIRILSTGEVGIGTISPTHTLQVDGSSVRFNQTNASYSFTSSSTSGYNTTINMNDTGLSISHGSGSRDIRVIAGSGGVRLDPAATSWAAISDIRLKKDVVPLEDDALEKLMGLRTIYYKLKEDESGINRVGLVAQEVQEILPEAIATDNNGYLAIRYTEIIPLVIKGIQEQQLQLDGFNSALETLENSQISLNEQFNNFKDSLSSVINTNLLNVQKLVAEQIEISGQNLDQYIKSVVQLAINNNELAIPDNNHATETNQPTILNELSIENDLGEAVANIDNQGNAQLAGDLTVEGSSQLNQLTADKANINDAQMNTASVSGELYAQSLSTDHLHTNNIDADVINGLQERLETAIAAQLNDSTLLASLMNNSSTTEEYLEQVADDMDVDLNNTNNDTNLDSNPTNLVADTITAQSAYIDGYFEVNGSVLIEEALAVGQTLLVGEGLTMGDGYIAFQKDDNYDLAIQPSGKGSLSLMADLLVLNESGLITISGDLQVAGTLEVSEELKVKDTLLTNLIKANNPDENIRVQLAQAVASETGEEVITQNNFEFVDEKGVPVATMSASGDLTLRGSLKVDQIPVDASVSAEASATANINNSTGQAEILAGQTEVKIKTARLTENSMIYVTPLTSTNNQVIYVKNKLLNSEFTDENEAEFTVGFDLPLNKDVQFNWWIIN